MPRVQQPANASSLATGPPLAASRAPSSMSRTMGPHHTEATSWTAATAASDRLQFPVGTHALRQPQERPAYHQVPAAPFPQPQQAMRQQPSTTPHRYPQPQQQWSYLPQPQARNQRYQHVYGDRGGGGGGGGGYGYGDSSGGGGDDRSSGGGYGGGGPAQDGNGGVGDGYGGGGPTRGNYGGGGNHVVLVSTVTCPTYRRQSTHRGVERARSGGLAWRSADLSLAQIPAAAAAAMAMAEPGGVAQVTG